jgi:hypothetical protein
MWDANVGTTTWLLDAAAAAGVPRIVYVSTVNVFGNTRGKVVDESYRRDLADGFLSWYDETKFGAHEVAEQRIADGAPITIAMPGTVIGPGDHTQIGRQLIAARDGKLPYVAGAELGTTRRPGSWRCSIAAQPDEPTCSPASASDSARRWRSRPRSVAGTSPASGSPTGSFGRWRRPAR